MCAFVSFTCLIFSLNFDEQPCFVVLLSLFVWLFEFVCLVC